MTAEQWLTINGFQLRARTWEKRLPIGSPFYNLQFIKSGGGWAFGTSYRCHYNKIYKHPSDALLELLSETRKAVESIDADIQQYTERITKERTAKLLFAEQLVTEMPGKETV